MGFQGGSFQLFKPGSDRGIYLRSRSFEKSDLRGCPKWEGQLVERWLFQHAGGKAWGSILVMKNKLLVLTDGGQLLLLAADKRKDAKSAVHRFAARIGAIRLMPMGSSICATTAS